MGQSPLFDRDFCEPMALLAAGTACAAAGGAAVAGFALFGAPAIALGAWSVTKWFKRLKDRTPDNARAVTKIQETLFQKLRGDGTLETIKPELRGRLDTELPTLIAAHWPSPQQIAKLSGQREDFPSAIAAYVLSEIDGSKYADDLYEATTVRRFVCLVVETALAAALEDKDYFATVEPQIAIETLNLTGQVKRDMESFVTDLVTIKDILSEAVPAILNRLEDIFDEVKQVHAEVGEIHRKLDQIYSRVVGDANPSPEEAKQTEQSLADFLASNLRASRDAADILLSQGPTAATLRLKQGLEEQSDARLEATKNEIVLLEQIATINYYDNGPEAVEAFEKIVALNHKDIDTWNRLGLLNRRLGRVEDARNCFGKVLKLSIEQADKEHEAIAHYNLGIILREQGFITEALGRYERAAEIYNSIGHIQGEASILRSIGIIQKIRGNTDEAIALHKRSLSLNQQIGFQEGIAVTLTNLGNAWLDKGEFEEAKECYLRSVKIHISEGKKEGQPGNYTMLGDIAEIEGRLDDATRYYQQSLSICEDLGFKRGMASNYGSMANLLRSQGQPDEATKLYIKAGNIFEEIGDIELLAVNYCNIGNAALGAKDVDAANQAYGEALKLNNSIGNIANAANTYMNMGNAALISGDPLGARKLYQKSLSIYQRIRNKEGEAVCHRSFGLLEAQLGDRAKARLHLNCALDIFKELGANRGVAGILEIFRKFDL